MMLISLGKYCPKGVVEEYFKQLGVTEVDLSDRVIKVNGENHLNFLTMKPSNLNTSSSKPHEISMTSLVSTS